jgi:DNA repair protein RadD
MPAQVLRDYQVRGLKQIMDAYAQGARSVLAVSPTGSGKTTLFGHLVAQLDKQGRRSLILAHRRELVTQACNRLREFDTSHGVILAGEAPRPYARVQVASVQTLTRRAAPDAQLVVCDEAHLSTATTWANIIEQYPNARILGVTATPWRLSGRPLAGAYDACVVVATPRELREQGHLCDYNGFSYLAPDLGDVRTTGGDYNEQDSARAMSASVIVDNVVEEWLKHASHLSTVVFAVTVEHSRQLVDRFRSAGVAAEHLDGGTPLAQREAIMRRVAAGTTRVLSNVGVCIEGLDIPRLKCCVLARPTMSLARAIQMMGRVRRPWEGVTARIHDHAFVIAKHGLPDQDRDYALSARPEKPPSLTTCPACLALFTGRICPACNAEKQPEPAGERKVQTVADAEQYEFSSSSESETPAARPPPSALPPVRIRWEKPGREVDGVYTRTWTEPTAYGEQRFYELVGERRVYHLAGTVRLDALMSARKVGGRILVRYTSDTPLHGGKTRREFGVSVWEDDVDGAIAP